MSLDILQLEQICFTEYSVTASMQKLYDVCSIDRFENEYEFFQRYITVNKRRGGELKVDK